MSNQNIWPNRYLSDYLKRFERLDRAEFIKLYQQDWPISEPEYREFMGMKFAVDPNFPDDTVIIQTGKESKVFRFK